MIAFGEGKTSTLTTKTKNTVNSMITRQSMGAKVLAREGNSPEY